MHLSLPMRDIFILDIVFQLIKLLLYVIPVLNSEESKTKDLSGIHRGIQQLQNCRRSLGAVYSKTYVELLGGEISTESNTQKEVLQFWLPYSYQIEKFIKKQFLIVGNLK